MQLRSFFTATNRPSRLPRRQAQLWKEFYPLVLDHYLVLMNDNETAILMADEIFTEVWKTKVRLREKSSFAVILHYMVWEHTYTLIDSISR